MSLIEGLGDEVTLLFTAILTILIVLLFFWINNLFRQVHYNGINQERNDHTNNSAIQTENSNLNLVNDANSVTLVEEESENRESIDDCSLPSPQCESKPVEQTSNRVNQSSQDSQKRLDRNSTEIRIQYVDGRQRHVIASLDDTIGNFKRENFSHELGVGEMVRLIACGRELRDEGTTLRNAGLNNNGVLHCLITATPTPNNQPIPQQDVRGNGMGNMLIPLLFLMLSLLWYIRIVYRFAFTGLSTFLLAAFTTVFLVGITISLSRQLTNNPRQHQL